MPKNLGLYNDDLSIPRKKDLDALETRIETNENNIATAQSDISKLNSGISAVEAVLSSKQDTIVGGASTVVKDDLVADRALVSNANGKIVASDVTSTELGYLDGVTSAIQTQIDDKVPATRKVNGHELAGDVTVSKSDIGLGNVDNVKQYSADNPPPYPVTSVNGMTGAVTIQAGGFKQFNVNVINGTANDTTANWTTLGPGYAFYNPEGQLIDKPSSYGFVVNYTYGGDIFQIWSCQNVGPIYYRTGNNAGWGTSWRKFDQEVLTQSAQPSGQQNGALWFQT